MNKYLVLSLVIVAVFAVITIISIAIAVIKGFRAGEAFVEVRIAGVFQFTIRLSNISKGKVIGSPSNKKAKKKQDSD